MAAYPDPTRCLEAVTDHSSRWFHSYQCARKAVDMVEGYGLCKQHAKLARIRGEIRIITGAGRFSGSPDVKYIKFEKDPVLAAEAMAEQTRKDREYDDRQQYSKVNKYVRIANLAMDRLDALGEDTSWLRSLTLMKPSEVDDAIAEADVNALVGIADKALGIGRVPEVGDGT